MEAKFVRSEDEEKWEEQEYIYYNEQQINPLQYLNPDKLIEATAAMTDTNPEVVQDVIDFIFRNLKTWMRDPYAKGGYYIPGFGTFSFNPTLCADEIDKIHRYIKNLPDEEKYDCDLLQRTLDNRDIVKKRYSLGLEYNRARKAKGKAINKYKQKENKKDESTEGN